MLHRCKFRALFSESPVPACRASRLKSMILWWTCSCICDPSLLFHADSCLMTSCSLYILQKPRSLHPWSPADPASCPTIKTWKGKGKNTNAKKTWKGEPDRNELVDPCASYKISERLHELQQCLFATCRFGRTYISKNQLVPACPVPGSFSRIELRALGPQRSDQNHHFCDIPENIWSSLDPANADRDHDSRCIFYGHPLILFTSTSETECYDSAAKRLCFRLYAHRTKHGTRTSRFVQLCSCGSKRMMF